MLFQQIPQRTEPWVVRSSVTSAVAIVKVGSADAAKALTILPAKVLQFKVEENIRHNYIVNLKLTVDNKAVALIVFQNLVHLNGIILSKLFSTQCATHIQRKPAYAGKPYAIASLIDKFPRKHRLFCKAVF